jgi:hypothetical protein
MKDTKIKKKINTRMPHAKCNHWKGIWPWRPWFFLLGS